MRPHIGAVKGPSAEEGRVFLVIGTHNHPVLSALRQWYSRLVISCDQGAAGAETVGRAHAEVLDDSAWQPTAVVINAQIEFHVCVDDVPDRCFNLVDRYIGLGCERNCQPDLKAELG